MKKTRQLLFTVVGLFFILHCTFTALYSFPQFIKNKQLQEAVGFYMFPLLNQNWKIFAPEPPLYSKKLKYRCYIINFGWTEWIDPGENLLEKHYKYRVSYHRKLYSIYEYIFRGLDQLPVQEANKFPIYKVSKKYFLNEAQKHFKGKEITQIQFELIRQFPKPELKTEKYSFKIFPAYKIKEHE